MLTIDWPGPEFEGWTDYIPLEWFKKVGRIENLWHSIYKPNERPLLAKLSIDVHEAEAVLNYCGTHSAFNETQGIVVGLIKILFGDDKRQSIESMLWKDAEDDPRWVDAGAAYGLAGDEQIDDDEGDRRLAIHMRSERKPWLAAEKKLRSQDSSGLPACDFCGPGLSDIYDPAVAW